MPDIVNGLSKFGIERTTENCTRVFTLDLSDCRVPMLKEKAEKIRRMNEFKTNQGRNTDRLEARMEGSYMCSRKTVDVYCKCYV